MRRFKKHTVKSEVPETSSDTKDNEHDLAYYIHDRVELMHQVFSILKPRELKVMAPECVQHISIDDLQELCLEELLGISSKRLCAILDGAEPPTDTESSSSEPMETISLDSISSDDEILSQHSRISKKHKHKKHKSKNKHKKRNSDEDKEEDKSKASRAGLTVLELLELQARARAIRAQLQQDVNMSTDTREDSDKKDSSDEVEIKEEPAEVVEISSEDEKPRIADLPVRPPSPNKKISPEKKSTSVTKRINDLVITVPQTKPTRKIKLNRNKTNLPNTSTSNSGVIVEKNQEESTNRVVVVKGATETDGTNNTKHETKQNTKTKPKKKQKKRPKKKEKEASDYDEITLQLSDTEKMDLLDFDRKNYENLTTSSSEDPDCSSESDDSLNNKEKDPLEAVDKINEPKEADVVVSQVTELKETILEVVSENTKEISRKECESEQLVETIDNSNTNVDLASNIQATDNEKNEESSTNNSNIDDSSKTGNAPESVATHEQVEDGELTNEEGNKLSEGEISEHTSEVVCISDDENIVKKKKEKKCKKDKKNKKSSKSNFREDADQNFFKEDELQKQPETGNNVSIDHDLYEILELSDDSSCYEVEGVSISKEPTQAEIEALSAKIDEQIHTDTSEKAENNEEVENISWRDRYLDSKKVKKVLSTANILNALRKKNKELKKKLEESKILNEKCTTPEECIQTIEKSSDIEEGSIEHFNTLEGSTKYVNPISESKDKESDTVATELKMDAKRLLKMYKKLLKHNDMYKEKDPNKKKKKKQKKSKEKSKSNGAEATIS